MKNLAKIMFNSHADFDKCLKEGSFIDESIVLPLNKMHPEFVMTLLNDKKNNWRLCQAKRIKDTDTAQFTKRNYLEKLEIDDEKYKVYFEKEIKPCIERSNKLIRSKFPDAIIG